MFLMYVVGILGLALLMIVHEAGHYLAARAFGMRVTTFSIGFGPTFFKIQPKDGFWWFTTAGERVRFKLFKHDPEKHGPTVFQVAMIPFLAYVQIAGMNPLEEHDPKDTGSYANAGVFARIVTIFGGPLANYLFASVFFFFVFYGSGYYPDKVEDFGTRFAVVDGNPAADAGLQTGDEMVSIAGEPVSKWTDIPERISPHPGEPVEVTVLRDGEHKTFTITPKEKEGRGLIGIKPARIPLSAKDAAIKSVEEPPKVVRDMVVGLFKVISGSAEGKLRGPAGIVEDIAEAAKRGWTDYLYLLGILSAYLGAFNLLPIPALDGGRLLFLGYEATTRKRPNALVEAHIHAIGLVMMLGLIAYITFANDLGLGK